MERRDQTLDQEVYSALREDLEQKKHVDMVFSYFNDSRGKVEYSMKCHRMALAAKSRLLHRMFLLQNGECNDSLSLILVGSEEMTPEEDLIRILYDPEKSGRDITLWDDEAIKLDQLEEFEVKPELSSIQNPEFDQFHDEEAMKEHAYDDRGLVEEEHDGREQERKKKRHKEESRDVGETKEGATGIDIGSYLKLSSKEKRHLEEVKSRLGLSPERVEKLVTENDDVIGYHEYKQDRWGRFNALTYDGALIPYSCCKDCRAVIEYRDLTRHGKVCKAGKSTFGSVATVMAESSCGVDATVLSHLLRIGSDKVKRYTAPESELPAILGEMFDCVRYEGKPVQWAVCKSCSMLVLIDSKGTSRYRNPWKYIESHKCNATRSRCADPNPVELDVGRVESLIKESDPDISLSYRTKKLGNFNNYLKDIRYQKSLVPFVLCRLCQRVIKEASVSTHECVTAIPHFTEIYKKESSRVSILKNETVNPCYLFIFPVKLDGELTDYAFCEKCELFFPKSVVEKSDYNHRCLKSVPHAKRFTFTSPNLRPVREGRRSENGHTSSYRCLLCDVVLKNPHFAEIHMRRVHGEGGREVMCTHCGKGFATLYSAHKHEKQHHGSREEGSGADYQCPVCHRPVANKTQLRIHMLRLHSDAPPSIMCELCGKGFKEKHSLKIHLKTHGEKTVPCDLCELKFRSVTKLKLHRMIHTGEKPNVCPYCQHGFIQLGVCKSHILKVHGVQVPKGMNMKKFVEGLANGADFAPDFVNKSTRGRKLKAAH